MARLWRAPVSVTRVLALTPVPEEGAGCRFRIAQFLPHLGSNGFQVTIDPFFTTEFFQLVYQRGRYGRKAALMLRQMTRRARLLSRLQDYDIVFLYREALPVGPPLIELAMARRGPALVYDFDDAVFLPNTSEANRIVGFAKWPQKVPAILRLCDRVIAGNEYLAAFARRHNPRVTVIPTCVDTSVFIPSSVGDRAGTPMVGWIGSPTTAKYLQIVAPALQRVAAAQPFVLRISGSDDLSLPGVPIERQPWSRSREVELFGECDVGIYPLPDDDWARGKCGFKAIQFMACGVPVVASAVGVNQDIVEDGVSGFLAATEDEWVEKLARLIGDASLRRRMGVAGRRTVEERYSLAVNAPKLAAVLEDALAVRAARDRGRALA